MAIDFLYLNEKDMIDAGVLDAKRCFETVLKQVCSYPQNMAQKAVR